MPLDLDGRAARQRGAVEQHGAGVVGNVPIGREGKGFGDHAPAYAPAAMLLSMKAWVVGGGLMLALSGCGEVRYLTQAAAGQLDLLVRARPVAQVLAVT